MSNRNPTVPTIVAPVLLDKAIQDLQIELSTISWLTKSFARAWLNNGEVNGQSFEFPEVYQGDGLDYYNCLPNDMIQAYCFWYVDDDADIIELGRNSTIYEERDVKLIFFFNMDKIDDTKGYNFTEELKIDVYNVLKANLSNLSTVTSYTDTIRDSFDDFTQDYIKPGFYSKKYGAMRFDITLRYRNEC